MTFCVGVVFEKRLKTYSACVFPGADEPDLSGDSEARSDGRGVLPQTEAGQHGGEAH